MYKMSKNAPKKTLEIGLVYSLGKLGEQVKTNKMITNHMTIPEYLSLFEDQATIWIPMI